MEILFVLSQIEVTGAETYALTLASGLKKLGHEIVLVSEKLRDSENFKFYSLPLHSRNTSYFGRFLNARALKKIIQDEKIDLVHSHSRAANLVSFFARRNYTISKKKIIPLVTTVHGRWRNTFAFRTFPCLGEKTIAVCPYLERYLVQDIKIPQSRVAMVPNGIDIERYDHNSGDIKSDPIRLLYCGRFSGQKGNVIRYLLKSILGPLFHKFKNLSLTIVPGTFASGELDQLAERFNQSAGRKGVEIAGGDISLERLYSEASVVVGSGRVIMEAMAAGRPGIAIGESSAPGLLSEANFESAFDSNFGDCGEWNLFLRDNSLSKDLDTILSNGRLRFDLGRWANRKAKERFDFRNVARQIESIYLGL